MGDRDWLKMEGIDPATATYPARANLAGEGILVFRLKDRLCGVERSCPHQKASLMDAKLVAGDAMLRCARHAFTFRLRDGNGVNCPGFRLKVYEIRQEGDALFARTID
jgi:nitrite reductase/ring-hydroxylating ferredoxin subunit